MSLREAPGAPLRARIAVVALAFPGYSLGEEMAPGKREEALARLGQADMETVPWTGVVTDRDTARQAGAWLAKERVDAVCAILTTFVPDHFLVDLLSEIDLPMFVWAVEREIGCISLVGAMLANPTLYGLGTHYQLFAGDLDEALVLEKLQVFARAAAMRRALRGMRVGYMGENPDIMFSMAVDELGLTKTFGVTVIPVRDFEYTLRSERVAEEVARADWREVSGRVGRVAVKDDDGVKASRGYLAMEAMAREMKLDALSINCWTHLKSKVCLPVARLNDQGIGAGCEGDLHSTILMRLLYQLSGRSTINGDFLRLFPEKNQVMFSHCGAGPFSMARSSTDIVLHASQETGDGIGVFYPADQPGTVTAVNLMGSREGYRLAALCGVVETTDMAYEGNPMRVRFATPVNDVLQSVVEAGAGHHWTLSYGDLSQELALLCRFLSVRFTLVR